MNYLEFKNQVKHFPLFSSSQLEALKNSNGRSLRNQLSAWKKQGLIIRLRNNLYILNENDRALTPSRLFLANQIYTPSYISTEYALSYYDLIPDRVVDLTSISSKKTMTFKNQFGTFTYKNLKSSHFFGFEPRADENGLPLFIAAPEKALIDHIYLNLNLYEPKNTAVFEESLRLQNLEQLNTVKLKSMAKNFNNQKFQQIVKDLIKFIKNSR